MTTAYALAALAGVEAPDTPESPGADFLTGVRDRLADETAHPGTYAEDFEDAPRLVVEAAMPVDTSSRYLIFVDLRAWRSEHCVADLKLGDDEDVALVLFGIGLDLVAALASDVV